MTAVEVTATCHSRIALQTDRHALNGSAAASAIFARSVEALLQPSRHHSITPPVRMMLWLLLLLLLLLLLRLLLPLLSLLLLLTLFSHPLWRRLCARRGLWAR